MIAMLLGTGFEPLEAVAPCDILRRGGLDVRMASIGERVVEAGHGIHVVADCTIDDLTLDQLDMVILPGGLGGVCSILESPRALALVHAVYDAGKYVCAICAAPIILANLGITDGKAATCYPGFEEQMGAAQMQNADVVRDGRVITGRAAGAAIDFGLALLAALKDEETANKVKNGIVYTR